MPPSSRSKWSPEQREEAREVLRRYAQVIIEVYEYYKANPEVYAEFKALVKKYPDRGIKIIPSASSTEEESSHPEDTP
jgi:hypothetical protein